jgi:hypothetical protein
MDGAIRSAVALLSPSCMTISLLATTLLICAGMSLFTQRVQHKLLCSVSNDAEATTCSINCYVVVLAQRV